MHSKQYKYCRLKHSRKSKAGFTLVETVIAMGLLSLIVAGSFALLVSSYATMRRTEESLYVNRLLESAIEMTRNLSFTDIAGDPTTGVAGYAASSPISFETGSTMLQDENGAVLYKKGMPDASDPAASLELPNGSGSIVFEQINPDLFRVTSRVSWTSFRRDTVEQSITTYIARGGIDKR